MAGDWIKMRDDLDQDQAVMSIASAVKLDVDVVIGKLWRLWSWAGRNTHNGVVEFGSPAMIDGVVKCEGFAHAMRAVCWLDFSESPGVRFPRWASHNSKSSKQRALGARRMANKRAKELRGQRNDGVTRAEQSRASEQQQTEEQKEISASQQAAGGDSSAGAMPAAARSLHVGTFQILRRWWPKGDKAVRLSCNPNATPERVAWLSDRALRERPERPQGFITKGITEGWDVPPDFVRAWKAVPA